jgi:ATP-dependent DNA ligase
VPLAKADAEFVDLTPDNHLRHSKFIALREDKKASEVRRE